MRTSKPLTKNAPKLDFIWYGMARLNCLTGHFPEAITSLNEAIRLNPANRYQARNDSDFKNLADDPRFTELLYPDTSAELPLRPDKWHYLAAIPADTIMQDHASSAEPRALRVVAMGGGTGLSTLLHGLKQYVVCGGRSSVDRRCCLASPISRQS